MDGKYDKFMKLNRELLDCYGSVHPGIYVNLDPLVQKDVCFDKRSQIEEMLIKGKIKPEDFFKASAGHD